MDILKKIEEIATEAKAGKITFACGSEAEFIQNHISEMARGVTVVRKDHKWIRLYTTDQITKEGLGPDGERYLEARIDEDIDNDGALSESVMEALIQKILDTRK